MSHRPGNTSLGRPTSGRVPRTSVTNRSGRCRAAGRARTRASSGLMAAERVEAPFPEQLVLALGIAGEHEAPQFDAAGSGSVEAGVQIGRRCLVSHRRVAESRVRERVTTDLLRHPRRLDRVQDVGAEPKMVAASIRTGGRGRTSPWSTHSGSDGRCRDGPCREGRVRTNPGRDDRPPPRSPLSRTCRATQ